MVNSTAKQVLQWMSCDYRGRGRPKNTVWKIDLEKQMLTAGYMSSWRKMEVEAQHKDEDGKQWSVAHVTSGATRLKSTSLIHSKHSAVIQLQIITVIMTAGENTNFPRQDNATTDPRLFASFFTTFARTVSKLRDSSRISRLSLQKNGAPAAGYSWPKPSVSSIANVSFSTSCS